MLVCLGNYTLSTWLQFANVSISSQAQSHHLCSLSVGMAEESMSFISAHRLPKLSVKTGDSNTTTLKHAQNNAPFVVLTGILLIGPWAKTGRKNNKKRRFNQRVPSVLTMTMTPTGAGRGISSRRHPGMWEANDR